MPSTNKIIRSFIYVDGELLYSLSSQIFEGFAQSASTSLALGKDNSDETKEFLGFGNRLEKRLVESRTRTEEIVLHDHIYALLEAAVLDDIVTIDPSMFRNLRAHVDEQTLIRVTGIPVVDDYARLNTVLSKVNDIMESINTIQYSKQIQELRKLRKEAKEALDRISDRNKKPQIQLQLNNIDNVIKSFKQKDTSPALDPEVISALTNLTEVFMKDAFDVVITPTGANAKDVVRGIGDRQWLRIPPDLLRRRYGTEIQQEWTMVGRITRLPVPPPKVPSTNNSTSSAEAAIEQITSNLEQIEASKAEKRAPSMLDAVRALHAGLHAPEQLSIISNERQEIFIAPIAIYETIRSRTSAISADDVS